MNEEYTNTYEEEEKKPAHYYGDVVRSSFLAIGIVLAVTILVDIQLITVYLVVGVVGILALVVLAGMTNPRSPRLIQSEALISGIGFVFFEYMAIAAFHASQTFADPVFFLRQLLAVLFLIALYFGVKSVRGTIS
jgi:hypothetical protein